jgi:hypothetical protein
MPRCAIVDERTEVRIALDIGALQKLRTRRRVPTRLKPSDVTANVGQSAVAAGVLFARIESFTVIVGHC